MSEHTPGPWMFELYEPEKKTEVCTIAHVGDYRVGFETPGYPGGNYRDSEFGHDEADARLMAAAPAMLEALEWISNLADKKHEEDEKLRSDGARTLRRIIERADAAIALAKGERE